MVAWVVWSPVPTSSASARAMRASICGWISLLCGLLMSLSARCGGRGVSSAARARAAEGMIRASRALRHDQPGRGAPRSPSPPLTPPRAVGDNTCGGAMMERGPRRGGGTGRHGALTVSQLTFRLKDTLEPRFSNLRVQGEVLSARAVSSGHLYFTLKDERAQLPCVVWRSTLQRLPLRVRDGMQVVATGDVQIYPPHGRYQLVIRRLAELGLGDLLARREALRRRLHAEGLFDPARKRPLPLLPRRIGVVTAATGAAIRDILATILRRYPAQVVLYPCRVQGPGAAASIARGVQVLAAHPGVDVLIIGRGGGSLEDLWAFEEEPVVRAVAACPIPVVSAVGHEIDRPLSDDAADVRAATPTAAGALVVPALADLRYTLAHHEARRDPRARVDDGPLEDRALADVRVRQHHRVLDPGVAVDSNPPKQQRPPHRRAGHDRPRGHQGLDGDPAAIVAVVDELRRRLLRQVRPDRPARVVDVQLRHHVRQIHVRLPVGVDGPDVPPVGLALVAHAAVGEVVRHDAAAPDEVRQDVACQVMSRRRVGRVAPQLDRQEVAADHVDPRADQRVTLAPRQGRWPLGLLLEGYDVVVGVHLDHPEAAGLLDRHIGARDRHVRSPLEVLGEHHAVVLLVDVVARQDQHVLGGVVLEDGQVLPDRVRGP
ncbi:MAG: exodeoxyribonuclease VII large subunit [Proteobacteria bacterium]|nr:MAG: exodeoxyribonuclease VII large subunit [Pseudomonadota bacterium]